MSHYYSVFQPFSSLGTFETLLSDWRNLDNQSRADLRILRELSKELAEPLSSTEPRLKNTVLLSNLAASSFSEQS
jgi:hypothetical protein